MKRGNRTFRLFVSSTFSDMKAERNTLQERVFPKLKHICERHGCRFQAIDLRWGVSEEAAMDQQAMNICLQELKRCQDVSPRPNFIVLLGDRYGWQPLPPQIKKAEFDLLMTKLSDEEVARLKFDEHKQDISQGEGNGWYRLDTNALPQGEYILLPRKFESPFETYEDWEPEERELLALLRNAASGVYPDPKAEERKKYFQSATHQEIEAGALAAREDGPEPEKHVLCWQRKFVREAIESSNDPDRADFVDLQPRSSEMDLETWKSQAPINDAYDRQQDLKRDLYDHLSEPNKKVHKNTPWPWQPSKDYLDSLCEFFERRLTEIIEAEVSQLEEIDPLDAENAVHSKFANERSLHFQGRGKHLATIRKYLMGDTPHPLIIHGVSGCGKTAVLAKAWAIREAKNKKEQLGEAIFGRIIGASPGSSSLRTLLRELGRQIEQTFGVEKSNIPSEIDPFYEWFESRLKLAKDADQKVILFLDALDQLQDREDAHRLQWLPVYLPKNVRIVVSILERPEADAGECYRNAQKRFSQPPVQYLAVPGLNSDEASQLFAEWFSEAKRQVTPVQFKTVAEAVGEDINPFFLRMIFDEMRRWTNWEKPNYAPGSITEAIERFLENLADPKRHDPILVERSLAYIAASRHGLAEDELQEVLAYDHEFWAHFVDTSYHYLPLSEPWHNEVESLRSPEEKKQYLKSPETFPREKRKIPAALWSRLNHDLASFLAEHEADGGILLGFYHRLLYEQCFARYLRPHAKDRHHVLADHFDSQPLWFEKNDEVDSRIPNVRKVSELLHHLVKIDDWDRLIGRNESKGILNDVCFFQAKCLVGQAGQYCEELERILETLEMLENKEDNPELEDYQDGLLEYLFETDHARLATSQKPPALQDPPLPPEFEIPDNQQAFETFLRKKSEKRFADDLLSILANNREFFDCFRTFPSSSLQTICNSHASEPLKSSARTELNKICEKDSLFLRSFHGRSDIPQTVATISFGEPPIKVWHTKSSLLLDMIATASVGGCIYLQYATSESDERISVGQNCGQFDLSYSGKFLVYTDQTGNAEDYPAEGVYLFDTHTRKVTLVTKENSVTALRLLPSEHSAILAAGQSLVELNLQTGSKREIVCSTGFHVEDLQVQVEKTRVFLFGRPLEARTAGRRQFTPEPRSLAAFDLETGDCLWTSSSDQVLKGVHVPPLGDVGVTWGWPSETGTVETIDLNSGALKSHFKSPFACNDAKLSVDSRWLVIANPEAVQVFDLSSRAQLRQNQGFGSMIRRMFGSPEFGQSTARKTLPIPTESVFLTPEGSEVLLRTKRKTIEKVNLLKCFSPSAIQPGYNSLLCIRFLDGEKEVITADGDGWLRVIDLESGEPKRLLEGHCDTVSDIIVSKSWIATSSRDSSIRIWDSDSLDPVATLTGHTDGVSCLEFLPTLETLISGSYDGEIRVWETSTWELRDTFRLQSGIHCIKATPDEHSIAIGLSEGSVIIVELATKLVRYTDHNRHSALVSELQFSRDGKKLLSSGFDGYIVLTDIVEEQLAYRVPIGSEKVAGLSPLLADGTVIVTGDDCRIRILDFFSGTVRNEYCDTEIAVFALSDSEQYIVGGISNALSKFSIADLSHHSISSVFPKIFHVGNISPDGNEIISNPPMFIRGVSLISGRTLFNLDQVSFDSDQYIEKLHKNASPINPVISADGSYALRVRRDSNNVIDKIKLPSAEILASFSMHRKPQRRIRILESSRNFKFVISICSSMKASEEDGAYLWSSTTGELISSIPELPKFDGIYNQIISAACAADRKGVAFVGSDQGNVFKGEANSNSLQWLCNTSEAFFDDYFGPKNHRVCKISISTDETSILIGDAEGKVSLFSLRDSHVVLREKLHSAEISDLQFCPSSDFFISAGKDKIVNLYSISERKIRGQYFSEAPVDSIATCFPQLKIIVNTTAGSELVDLSGCVDAFDSKPTEECTSKFSSISEGNSEQACVPPLAYSFPTNSTLALVGLVSSWDSNEIEVVISEMTMGEWRTVELPIEGRIGRNGLAWGRGLHPELTEPIQKREGDLRTPAGVFKIGAAWGYDDTIRKDPAMPYTQITTRDLWVEDPQSPHYNMHLRLDHAPRAPAELEGQMIQNSLPHSLKLFVCHNKPPKSVPGAGSAIFLRIWDDDGKKPTKGGIGVSESNLKKIISRIDPEKNPVLVILPKSEYQSKKAVWGLP